MARYISRQIKCLDSANTIAPDKAQVIVLKNFIPVLSPILMKLFSTCVKEKFFPPLWKMSGVCPVFENAVERSSPSKYRPVSLLNVISVGAIIKKKGFEHFKMNNIVSNKQYGFRSSRSTADVLS